MAISSTSGQGRPKGSQNKITKDLKAMLLGSLDAVGGQAYFERQAEENPTAYMTLIGKLIPHEIAKSIENTESSAQKTVIFEVVE